MPTSNEEPYPIENYSKSCSAKFNTFQENLFYGLQALYLIPTLALLIWILVTLRVRYWENYRKLLWWWIFAMDCVVSIILILLDLSITRLFLYFPQLCPFFSKIFTDYPLINHIYFPLYNYLRAIKPVIQCALALLRLLGVSSISMFKSNEHLSKIYKWITVICLIPLLVIWNTVISEKEVVFWRGGFFIIYHRYISWASLSKLHLSFLVTALIFILVICVCAHYQTNLIEGSYKRVMTLTTLFVVLAFIMQASFQCYYALFRHAKWFPSQLVDYQFIIYDFLTVGTPIVVISTSSSLRRHLVTPPETKKERRTIEFYDLRSRKKSSDSKQSSDSRSEECSDEESGKH